MLNDNHQKFVYDFLSGIISKKIFPKNKAVSHFCSAGLQFITAKFLVPKLHISEYQKYKMRNDLYSNTVKEIIQGAINIF